MNSRNLVTGLKSRQVTLLVGPDKTPIVALEDYLCTVKFFEAALRGGFKEASTGVIELPEEDPAVVADFLGWLIRGFENDPENDGFNCAWTNITGIGYIVNLVSLALKWNLPELADQCYHLIFRQIETKFDEDWGSEVLYRGYRSLREYPARFLLIHACLCKVVESEDNIAFWESIIYEESRDVLFWEDYAKYKLIFNLNELGAEEGNLSKRHQRDKLLLAVLQGKVTYQTLSTQATFLPKPSSQAEFEGWVGTLLGL